MNQQRVEVHLEELGELEAELRDGGWRRTDDWGDHWWSRSFVPS
jgi:hypothetical protein